MATWTSIYIYNIFRFSNKLYLHKNALIFTDVFYRYNICIFILKKPIEEKLTFFFQNLIYMTKFYQKFVNENSILIFNM